ncbi:MAG: CHAT domain-containing protein [Acidobacteriota bacterium]
MEYKNFILDFGPPGQVPAYPVSVRSPAGADNDFFVDPFFSGDLPADTEMVGGALFDAAFHGRVRDLYFKSLGMVEAPRMGLRIQIRINPTDSDLAVLAGYPWEVLFDTVRRQFLTLDPRTPIVRTLGVPRPPRAARFTEPLSILGIASNPGADPLPGVEQERGKLQKACAKRPNVCLDLLEPPCTPEDLHKRLQEGERKRNPFQVLHFMGHSRIVNGQGCLIFQNSKGSEREVTADDLKDLIGEFEDIRLIFLNSCNTATFGTPNPFTGVAGALVLRGFPAVIAMRSAIEDEAAAAFSDAFYDSLLGGKPLEVAVQAGRLKAKMAAPTDDWGLPILFLQAQEELTVPRDLLKVSKWAVVLAVPALALSLWLLRTSSEFSIDIPAEGSRVPALIEVKGHGQHDSGKHYYLMVKDPDEKCWLQGSAPLSFDSEGGWSDQVQLQGDPGDSYTIFLVSSSRLLSSEPRWPDESDCHLLAEGTRAVRHVYRDSSTP